MKTCPTPILARGGTYQRLLVIFKPLIQQTEVASNTCILRTIYILIKGKVDAKVEWTHPFTGLPQQPSFTHLWDQLVQVALQTQSVQVGQALPEGQFFLEVLPSQGDPEVLVCHGMLLPVQAVSEPGYRVTLL